MALNEIVPILQNSIQKTQFGFFSHYDTYDMYRNEKKIQTGSFVCIVMDGFGEPA